MEDIIILDNTIIIWKNNISATFDSSIFVRKIIFPPPPTFLYSPNRFNVPSPQLISI